ncbi:hypothetical protein [Dietzia sp. 179-F 9C3 NHS]|uniref:hypothetical protein n=1 Tax=Dietzia sp. 179-F 9C3 NHS TaxID=3374295 RepID=UPI003879FC8B
MSTIPVSTVTDSLESVEGVSTSVYRSLVVAKIADAQMADKVGDKGSALRALAEASHLGRQWKKSATNRGQMQVVMEAETFIDRITDLMHGLCAQVLS